MDNQYLKNIKPGMRVTILTSQHKYSTGPIAEVAARTPFHEQGIMVRLKNGDVGRVKHILLSDSEQNEKSETEVRKLIEAGENSRTEFKAEALWSTTLSHAEIKEAKSFELREYGQRASKVIIVKSLAAFLNSNGGNLLIGVKENKEKETFDIVGIGEDIKKLKTPGTDAYRRILIDELIRAFLPAKIFNHLEDYIEIEFVNLDGKTLCWLKIKKSDSRVFLKINDREIFMIRVDSENRTLEGEKLVDYCIRKWGAR